MIQQRHGQGEGFKRHANHTENDSDLGAGAAVRTVRHTQPPAGLRAGNAVALSARGARG